MSSLLVEFICDVCKIFLTQIMFGNENVVIGIYVNTFNCAIFEIIINTLKYVMLTISSHFYKYCLGRPVAIVRLNILSPNPIVHFF